MKTSQEWIEYFNGNLKQQRIDWSQPVAITAEELKQVLKSLQSWQLGESCEGNNLIRVSKKYAAVNNDALYVDAIKLFIKEEQKHGYNLGRYLDVIGQPRIRKDWFDTLFRKIRNLNSSMEIWSLAVLVGESAAQIFYQSLKDATSCTLLKEICTDILIDEAAHIPFQQQRLAAIVNNKKLLARSLSIWFYSFFFSSASLMVWMSYRKVFKAGGHTQKSYLRIMRMKKNKTVRRLLTKHTTATTPLLITSTVK